MGDRVIEFREENLLVEYWGASGGGLGFVFAHADSPEFYLHMTPLDALEVAGFGLSSAARRARMARSIVLVVELHRLLVAVRSALRRNPLHGARHESAWRGTSLAEWAWPASAAAPTGPDDRTLHAGRIEVRVDDAGALTIDKSFRALGEGDDLLERMAFADREFVAAMRFALSTIASGATDMDPLQAIRATRRVLANMCSTYFDRLAGKLQAS